MLCFDLTFFYNLFNYLLNFWSLYEKLCGFWEISLEEFTDEVPDGILYKKAFDFLFHLL